MVPVTQCREENQGRRDWFHLFLLWSFFAVVSPVQSQPQTAMCSGGVFKQVWTLESLPNILPSPMHTSGAVVSCLFIWRWVRSFFASTFLVRVQSHTLFLTSYAWANCPCPIKSLFSHAPEGVCIFWSLLCCLFVSAGFVFSWSWHAWPFGWDLLFDFFPFCRYLGFHLPSHTCPLPQAREIPAHLALAYNSHLPNQDLSKPRTVNTMCAVPIMGKFLSLSLYYSFSFSFLLILSFSPSLFTSVYLSLPFIFI